MQYKAIGEYMSSVKNALKAGAVTGLAAVVLTASGCAHTGGGRLTLGELEWGGKTAITGDEETKKHVIDSDAKYEDQINAVPGKGFGFNYNK